MFGNKSEEFGVAGFSDQFEPVGNNFVYRRNSSGPPIPVSAKERDCFVTAFDNFQVLSKAGIIGSMLLPGIIAVFFPALFTELPDGLLIGVVALIAVLYTTAFFWAWNAPARALRARSAVGEALSPAQMRSRFLAKISYGQLALVGMTALILFWLDQSKKFSPGWNLLLGVAILLVAGLGFRALRKRRF